MASCLSSPAPGFLGVGVRILFIGRLLLLRSGDLVPNTPAASLRDAHLTDKRSSQSPSRPRGKVEFLSEPIGRQGGRALVIGVLFGVESSKQPWSRGGGRASGASSCRLAQGGVGNTPDKRSLGRCAAESRKGRPLRKKRAPVGVPAAPAPGLLTRGSTAFLFCAKPQRFCFHPLTLLHAGV